MSVILTVKTAEALEALQNDLSGLQENLRDGRGSAEIDLYAVDQAILQVTPVPDEFPLQLEISAAKIAEWLEIAILNADGYNGDVTLTGPTLLDTDFLLIANQDAFDWLESDFNGRLQVLKDDGNDGSPSAEDLEALREWLVPHLGPFPLLLPLELGSSQLEEMRTSIENLNDYAGDDAGDAAGNLHIVASDDLQDYAARLKLQLCEPPHGMDETRAQTFIQLNLADVALHCVAETEPYLAAEELNPTEEPNDD